MKHSLSKLRFRQFRNKHWLSGIVLLTCSIAAFGAAPPGYYDTADASSAAQLRVTLHNIIKDHTRYPYTATTTDTWDVLESADQNMDDPGSIITIYRNATYPKFGGGNSFYNREHSWPKSYGFPVNNPDNYPYTDMHHLFLADSGYNSSRSNKPYDFCSPACGEKTSDFNNGRGGGSGVYPGNSSWTDGSFTQGRWETWVGRRGDVARALMYMDVRYEGGNHGITGSPEPDLILTDDLVLIDSSNTGANLSVAYMGKLSVLLQWATEDPVDNFERQHTDVVFSFQGNRNPFVDHPEWVACVFQNVCGPADTIPPAAPTGLLASGDTGQVLLAWNTNTEPDLNGYNVYRSETSGGPYAQLNGTPLPSPAYTDSNVVAGTTYFYVVTAEDTSANESVFSAESSAVPTGSGGGGGSTAWINEFHYDNKGGDKNEFVEIAASASTDLTGWQIVAYNGNGGAMYGSANLSGSVLDQQGCMGTASVNFAGLQNGAPDGIALVDAGGQVVQFISYEGTFTAIDGPAAGTASTDVGVSETSGTKRGHSLQLAGSGATSADFVWQAPATATRDQVNTGQIFNDCSADTTPPAVPSGVSATGLNAQVSLSWSPVGDLDLAGYNVYRATTSGGPYTQINGALVVTANFDDTGVSNGVTYYYAITAQDTVGNESAFSAEVQATPQQPASSVVWINEFHYDNAGADSGEFIEVAGTAGTNLSGWSLVGYNGNGGGVYKTVTLSGTIPSQQNGKGTLSFSFTSLQNGSPDGIALVQADGTVVEFLSYEGTLVASGGAANGMTSTDVGVAESGSTPVGQSLQRVGTGNRATDFTWQAPAAASAGTLNSNQTLTSG